MCYSDKFLKLTIKETLDLNNLIGRVCYKSFVNMYLKACFVLFKILTCWNFQIIKNLN